ncbi:MAG: diguanylate cyclase [Holophaga sp.]|nr:diguanylate cyclase [Holophaga sp.]
MEEAQVLKLLVGALEGLPPEAPLRPVLETTLREHRKLHSQLRKISRIGDRYQEQLRDLNQELIRANDRLSLALTEVKTLQGFIPICARCKRIRDDHGYWEQVEAYISRHSDAVFSHGVCPDCSRILFPGVDTSRQEAPQAGSRRRAFQSMEEETDLEVRLALLQSDPTLHDNPLKEELGSLTRRHLHMLRRLGKIAHISDGFQLRLKQVNLALAEASFTDLLTGLSNRRAMMERIHGELDRSARGGCRPALLMVDVDHFKLVNDTYGHEMGDEVLQALAAAMRSAIRGYDTCARWGGEEFLVLLPETDMADAVAVGEKLRGVVHQPCPEHPALPSVTISVGVAVHREGETLPALLRRADDAMYEAKRLGRDRVEAAEA